MSGYAQETDWKPPMIGYDTLNSMLKEYASSAKEAYDYLVIFRMMPYIDAVHFHYSLDDEPYLQFVNRYVFHEGYAWSPEYEYQFEEYCLRNPGCVYSHQCIDDIFDLYSSKYPEWNLKRYYTKDLRLLDHIYHCMRRGTLKEMLYKAGLDEIAFQSSYAEYIDETASKPSDAYGGVSMRILRAVNCEAGAALLAREKYRKFLTELQKAFPDTFSSSLNDAQCRYLKRLIDGDLTVGECGRLFNARRMDLFYMWCKSQYDEFILRERKGEEERELLKRVSAIDPIYAEYVRNKSWMDMQTDARADLIFFLLSDRENYDHKIRVSNRRRDPDWQERDHGYVVRYPQTINDFCRESIYMSNCLMTYCEAFINNDTTLLFMRKTDDVNKPFITMEIFGNELLQAYHRYNQDCTGEEAKWIREYCERHNIGHSKFKFNAGIDLLF